MNQIAGVPSTVEDLSGQYKVICRDGYYVEMYDLASNPFEAINLLQNHKLNPTKQAAFDELEAEMDRLHGTPVPSLTFGATLHFAIMLVFLGTRRCVGLARGRWPTSGSSLGARRECLDCTRAGSRPDSRASFAR